MERGVEIGVGELLTVVELPVSLENGITLDTWRTLTDAALGFLICRLDQRVAGQQLAEDVILLHAGEPVAAAEGATNIRSFMPFEVTAPDQAAPRNSPTLTSTKRAVA